MTDGYAGTQGSIGWIGKMKKNVKKVENRGIDSTELIMALDELEKEKGIIAQEINMYNDYPDWEVYMNALRCMYKKNPITIDIAGTVESIQEIDKDAHKRKASNFFDLINDLNFC